MDKKKRSLLIVDDEVMIAQGIKDALSYEYDVLAVNDGKSALKAARDFKPGLILLDIMMPGMDGYEVHRALKDDEQTAFIPVIYLTSRGQLADMEKGLKKGAYAYIVKPFSPARLAAKIDKVFCDTEKMQKETTKKS
jgi:DNA-binding response OmpR family regulator